MKLPWLTSTANNEVEAFDQIRRNCNLWIAAQICNVFMRLNVLLCRYHFIETNMAYKRYLPVIKQKGGSKPYIIDWNCFKSKLSLLKSYKTFKGYAKYKLKTKWQYL